ncbi:MAG: hypothetical protein H0U62_13365 [Actinobacteria bacterium]|nr:hypothetical protein [Actinomycetota bacterium]
MAELARFALDDGGSVTVEVDEEPGISRAARPGQVIRAATASFDKALVEVRDAAAAAVGQFQAMAQRPDEVEIMFGVKLDAQAGAVIAKTGLQGQFEVRLRWQREQAAEERA